MEVQHLYSPRLKFNSVEFNKNSWKVLNLNSRLNFSKLNTFKVQLHWCSNVQRTLFVHSCSGVQVKLVPTLPITQRRHSPKFGCTPTRFNQIRQQLTNYFSIRFGLCSQSQNTKQDSTGSSKNNSEDLWYFVLFFFV